MKNPDALRKEARNIVHNGKDAQAVWAELVSWSAGKGHLAMRMAVTEFMSEYGSRPEAARMMPEILHDAGRSIGSSEKGALIRLTARPHEALGAGKEPLLAPKKGLPLEKGRPSPVLSLHPIKGPYSPGSAHPFSADHAAMRDIHLRMRESSRLSLGAPPRPDPEQLRAAFSPAPGSYMGAQKGEHLIKSLIHKVRSHAQSKKEAARPAHAAETQHAPAARPSRSARKRTAKKKTAKKPRRAKPVKKPRKAVKKAKKAKTVRKAKSARRPARKAPKKRSRK